jgi:hypothetical protein
MRQAKKAAQWHRSLISSVAPFDPRQTSGDIMVALKRYHDEALQELAAREGSPSVEP